MRPALYSGVLLSFFLLFVLIETLKRKFKVHPEITRKILHVSSGLGAIFWSGYLAKNEFIFFTGIFLIYFGINMRKKFMLSLILSHRKTAGEITYLFGLTIYALLLYSQRSYFIFGILVLMIPDAAAGLVSHFLKKSSKDVLHALTYGISAFFVSALLVPPGYAVFFSLVLTAVEYYSGYGSDNLTVPLAFALLVRLIL